MEVQRSSPRHTNIQTSPKSAVIPVAELPVASPKHGVLVEAAAKSPAPPPESKASSDSSTKDFRGVKRKASSVSKETVQAIENASHKIAESIDRMHTAISQVAADALKEHDVFFQTELNYLKKRDRHIFRNQQNLISAINALTEIITTGIKKTAQAEDGGAGAE